MELPYGRWVVFLILCKYVVPPSCPYGIFTIQIFEENPKVLKIPIFDA